MAIRYQMMRVTIEGKIEPALNDKPVGTGRLPDLMATVERWNAGSCLMTPDGKRRLHQYIVQALDV